jgi:hypothetical protein
MKKCGVTLILTALGACCLAFGQDNTILAPNVLNLVVGETHSIQALNPAGQPVTGLTWTSSDPTVVSLSTDDPPVLSALAAGHVTITAGTATADVTVSAGALPLGTVIWSNPGNGSDVYSIVPAVPSSSGVADVFAFQYDGTVQAITSDGTTAWTADVSNAWPVLPDFQGGLVAVSYDGNGSIVKFDGMTGQPYAAYTPPDPTSFLYGGYNGVHPDGTVFTVLGHSDPNGIAPQQYSVVGIDPTTGSQKFSVPLPQSDSAWGSVNVFGLIIAGDGYAYVPYANRELSGSQELNHLALLRVNSSGDFDQAPIYDWTSEVGDFVPIGEVKMITNADTGILLTWGAQSILYGDGPHDYKVYMTITTGASAGAVLTPALPGNPEALVPVLQAQDGSFVGRVRDMDTWDWSMIAFDPSGSVRWSVVGDKPQIATADGGVIGQSGTIYDQSGSVTGQMAGLPTYSWTGNAYQIGSTEQLMAIPPNYAVSYAAVLGGNLSGQGTYVRPYDAPQEALRVLATTDLTATPQCNALLAQFANISQIPQAALIAELQATANDARDYTYDGPISSTALDPVKFPGVASSGVTTVGQWFAADSSREGLSQFNGSAVWVRLNDWHSWIKGWFSQFLIFSTGKVNYYGMGTVMHEILHKQAVGGGFTHSQMNGAIGAVGWPSLTIGHNNDSEGIGKLCFGNLQ